MAHKQPIREQSSKRFWRKKRKEEKRRAVERVLRVIEAHSIDDLINKAVTLPDYNCVVFGRNGE